MSKSAPYNALTSLKISCPALRLNTNSSFEFIVSQMQRQTDKILCVIDGCRLVLYEKTNELPTTLIFEHKKINRKSDSSEYFYRCTQTDTLYAFFSDHVNSYLKCHEDKQYCGKVVNASTKGQATQTLSFFK